MPDRADYNVPDEVQTMVALDVATASLPMYIAEMYHRDVETVLRVFSNVRGRRDLFFEGLPPDWWSHHRCSRL